MKGVFDGIISTVAFCCAVDMIVLNFLPQKTKEFEKSLKFVIGLLLAISISSLVFNGFKDFGLSESANPTENSNNYSFDTEQYVITQTEENLKKYMFSQLSQIKGIKVYDISIKLDMRNTEDNEKKEVYIKEARVKYDGNQKEEIRKVFMGLINTEPIFELVDMQGKDEEYNG